MVTRFNRIHERDRQTPRNGMLPAPRLCIVSRGKHLYNAIWRVERGPQFRCTRHTWETLNQSLS